MDDSDDAIDDALSSDDEPATGQSSRYYWLFIVKGNLEYLQIGRFQARITWTTY